MAEQLTIDFGKPIPLFPLRTCVLLPHATVPLHVFEPRYRAMVRDVLDSAGLIAMAVYSDRPTPLDQGGPPLSPHACLGYVARHERLPDGRYHILLQGLCRVRIARELDADTPYRVARLEPTETDPPMEIDLGAQRRRLESLLGDQTLGQLASIKALGAWVRPDMPTLALIDLVTLAVCRDARQRYAMLAETDAAARSRWLEDFLDDTRHTLEIANRVGPSVTEDGTHLN